MRSSTVLSVLSTLALVSAQTSKLGDAPVVTNNPIGASYYATLPDKESESVRGTVYAVSSPTGKGVDFDITLSGLPAEGSPFLYHIHAAPVPPDGNCTGTLAHLDPYVRGEDSPCDPTQKQTCQVGDLSGKYGKINGTTFSAAYTDLYASLVIGTGAYFGNRSVVVHYANKTRITCANFTTIATGYETPVPNPGPSGVPVPPSNATLATASGIATGPTSSCASGSATATPPSPSLPIATTNAAVAGTWVSSGAMLAGVVAMVLQ